MFFELDPNDVGFPDPSLSEPDGLLAMGGDLSFERLVNAYALGIFPWYNPGEPILWWSLNPRMVLSLPDFRCSKSLRRTLNTSRFEVRVDTCFEEVIRQCAATPRADQDGTWITDEMQEAFIMLHHQGLAHSFETFLDGTLVGGLYGVSLGDFFSGESMFHHVTDASKVAFSRLVDFCSLHHFRFIDAQQPTTHLASLGAKPIDRKIFLNTLSQTRWESTYRDRWPSNTVVLLIGGNQGDRVNLLLRAQSMIAQQIGPVAQVSTIYETEPWGFQSDQNFLNQALVVDTDLTPHQVLTRALNIEKALGRQRPANTQGYSSRPMDIDLIFFNSAIVRTPDLQLPHPRMHLRRFVLEPLAEIIPQYIHPLLRQTIQQLASTCPDHSAIWQFPQ